MTLSRERLSRLILFENSRASPKQVKFSSAVLVVTLIIVNVLKKAKDSKLRLTQTTFTIVSWKRITIRLEMLQL